MSLRTPIEQLFDALRQGDERALRELLPPVRDRLLHLAEERMRDRQRAEEVVQDALGTWWEKRSAIRDPEHVIPCLYQILRNKIGNSYMQERRHCVIEHDRPYAAAGVTSAGFASPALEAEASEMKRILGKAIRRCAAEHALWGRILRLLQEGRSAAEIRTMLGIPTGTIYSRVHRARARLRQILEDEFKVKL